MKTTRTARLWLLIIIVVLIGTAGKLTVDKVAADNLAKARKTAEDSVSADKKAVDQLSPQVVADKQAVDQLAAQVVADKQAVDKLAHKVAPGKSELVCAGGIPNRPGTYAGMCGIRTVPDPEAQSKLAADRKVAANKLAGDEAASEQAPAKLADDELAAKQAAAKLGKDTVTADSLARAVRWQDAFGVHE